MTDMMKAKERRFCIECRHSRPAGRGLRCHRHQVTVYSDTTGEWLPAMGDPIPPAPSNAARVALLRDEERAFRRLRKYAETVVNPQTDVRGDSGLAYTHETTRRSKT